MGKSSGGIRNTRNKNKSNNLSLMIYNLEKELGDKSNYNIEQSILNFRKNPNRFKESIEVYKILLKSGEIDKDIYSKISAYQDYFFSESKKPKDYINNYLESLLKEYNYNKNEKNKIFKDLSNSYKKRYENLLKISKLWE